MADINLLQSSDNGPITAGHNTIRVLNIVGAAVFLLSIIATGVMTAISKSDARKLNDVMSREESLKADVTSNPSYGKLIVEQKKLQNLQKLLDTHINWSIFFPRIFSATLKNVIFTKFTATKDGQADVSGYVANFADLDKLLQGYQQDAYSSYIKDVKLVNIGVSGGGINGVLFTIRISFNSSVILPNDLTAVFLSDAAAQSQQQPFMSQSVTSPNGGAVNPSIPPANPPSSQPSSSPVAPITR